MRVWRQNSIGIAGPSGWVVIFIKIPNVCLPWWYSCLFHRFIRIGLPSLLAVSLKGYGQCQEFVAIRLLLNFSSYRCLSSTIWCQVMACKQWYSSVHFLLTYRKSAHDLPRPDCICFVAQQMWWDVCSTSAANPRSFLFRGCYLLFLAPLVRKTKSSKQIARISLRWASLTKWLFYRLIRSLGTHRLSHAAFLLRLLICIINVKSPQLC